MATHYIIYQSSAFDLIGHQRSFTLLLFFLWKCQTCRHACEEVLYIIIIINK